MSTSQVPSLARRILTRLAFAAASLVIVAAVAVGGFRLLVNRLPGYQNDLKAWVSRELGLALTFDRIDARWGLAGPELTFSDVSLGGDSGGPLLDAREVDIGLSPLRLVLERQVVVDRVTVSGTHLTIVRGADGRFNLRGVAPRPAAKPLTLADLPTVRLFLRDAELSYVDEHANVDWRLTGVAVELGREDRRLSLTARATPPDGVAGHIAVTADVDIGPSGGEPSGWRASVAIDDAVLAEFAELLGPQPVVLEGGHGDLSLWIDASADEALRGTLEVAVDGLELARADRPQPVRHAYERVRFTGEWARRERGWQVALSDVDVTRGGRSWPRGGHMNLELAEGQSGIERVTLAADFIRLEDVTPLLALWPEQAFAERWVGLAPQGSLREASLDATHLGGEWQYSVAGTFEELGVASTGPWPGFSGLAGELRADTAGGRLTLSSRAAGLTWPGTFAAPIGVDQLEGTLVWRRGRNGVRVVSDNLIVANADAATRSNLELTLPGDDSSPRLELETHVSGFEAEAIKRYLPQRWLPAAAARWIDRAILGGWVSQMEITLFGPLQAFPFDRGEGQFHVAAEVQGGALDYLDGWPLAEGLNGTVEFLNAGFRARGRGRVLGNESNNIQVDIPDLRAAVLEVRGTSFGPLTDVLAFLQQAPLIAHHLGPYFGRISAEGGQGEATVDLALPLRAMDQFDLSGKLRIIDGELSVAGFAPHATEIEGELDLRNGLVSGQNIDAILMRGPVTARVSPATQTGYRTQIAFDGEIGADAMFAAFGVPTGGHVAGQTKWQGSILIPSTDGETHAPVMLGLSSNLTGVALRYPAPLAKAPAEPLGLQLDMSFLDGGGMEASGYLGATRRFVLRFDTRDERLAFARGEVRFGGAFPALPSDPGLRLGGQVPALELDQWLALASRSQSAAPVHDALLGGDLTVADFIAFGQHLGNTELSLRRGDNQWLATVDSEAVSGTLSIPFNLSGRPQVVADMQRMYLGFGGAVEGERGDPRSLPGLKLTAADFAISGRRFGALTADIQADPLGLRLVSFASHSGSFDAEGSGAWFDAGTDETTRLAFVLTSSDVSKTLDELGFDAVAEGERAEITASVHWPGGPGADWLAHLAGDVGLRVENGSLLDLEPGAGRVMGLMSITALPRRLALDFRDVFNRGLVFDTVAGDFLVADGNAYTNNLKLTGPVAEIGVVGRTGLRDHDYQQQAVVTAEPGKMLPTVGGLIAGPGVGAALLIFTRIFRESLKGIGRASYCVTGPWEHPEVERLSAEQLESGQLCAALPPQGMPAAPAEAGSR